MVNHRVKQSLFTKLNIIYKTYYYSNDHKNVWINNWQRLLKYSEIFLV